MFKDGDVDGGGGGGGDIINEGEASYRKLILSAPDKSIKKSILSILKSQY